VQVADEHGDRGAGVFAAGADVVEAAVHAQGELAGDVGAVGANTVLSTGGAVTRGGLGPGAAAKRRSPART
jgi:hypothetical protein